MEVTVDDGNHNGYDLGEIEKNDYSDPSKIVPPKTLDDLIDQLLQVFDRDQINVDYVMALLNAYSSNKAQWDRYAVFDAGRYTRNLVHQGNGKFNLMILCWSPSNTSSIHDHWNSHCFMKCLEGELQETQYHWPDETGAIRVKGTSSMKMNDTAYIHDKIGLHRIANESEEFAAVSLHLYSPPFDHCHVYNDETGQRQTIPMIFWSKFGEGHKQDSM